MPLLDHFHRPMADLAPWPSVNTLWIGSLVTDLNRRLPLDRYRAYANRRLGPDVEADIAEFELAPAEQGNGAPGAVAVKQFTTTAVLTMPAIFPDDLEVRVADAHSTLRLLAVIELVSPSNKKEPRERTAFVAKCAAYLERGIGLVVVDVVTERHANLHDELVRLFGLAEPFLFPTDAPLYATAYRPARRGNANVIDLWPHALEVGRSLPTVPLHLRGAFSLPLDLEATYMDARSRSGV